MDVTARCPASPRSARPRSTRATLTALSCGAPWQLLSGRHLRPSVPAGGQPGVPRQRGRRRLADGQAGPGPGQDGAGESCSIGQISCPAAGDCGRHRRPGRGRLGASTRRGGTWAPAHQVKGVTGPSPGSPLRAFAACRPSPSPPPTICVAGGNDHNIAEVLGPRPLDGQGHRPSQPCHPTPSRGDLRRRGKHPEDNGHRPGDRPDPGGQGHGDHQRQGRVHDHVEEQHKAAAGSAARQLKPGTYKVTAAPYRGAAPYKTFFLRPENLQGHRLGPEGTR